MSTDWVLVAGGYGVCALTWAAYALLLRRSGRARAHRREGGP